MKEKASTLKLLEVFLLALIVILSQNCKQESASDSALAAAIPALEINVQSILDSTGIQFSIIKTENIGYLPLHKFLWVSLEQKLNQEKLKQLAQKIIQDIIAKKPETYHSFTIHYCYSDKTAKSEKQPAAYATVTYLPEGDWVRVGRSPLNNYASYKLVCTIENNMIK